MSDSIDISDSFESETPHQRQLEMNDIGLKAIEVAKVIADHPFTKSLRSVPGIRELHPHSEIPTSMRHLYFTSDSLIKPNKLEVSPVCFLEKTNDLARSTTIFYVGPALCSYPGIVHGGLLATMLDEGLGYLCYRALPNKNAVTASLGVRYMAPCPSETYLVMTATITDVKGRKALAKGYIKILGQDSINDQIVVEADAVVVEPKVT